MFFVVSLKFHAIDMYHTSEKMVLLRYNLKNFNLKLIIILALKPKPRILPAIRYDVNNNTTMDNFYYINYVGFLPQTTTTITEDISKDRELSLLVNVCTITQTHSIKIIFFVALANKILC